MYTFLYSPVIETDVYLSCFLSKYYRSWKCIKNLYLCFNINFYYCFPYNWLFESATFFKENGNADKIWMQTFMTINISSVINLFMHIFLSSVPPCFVDISIFLEKNICSHSRVSPLIFSWSYCFYKKNLKTMSIVIGCCIAILSISKKVFIN